MSAIHQTVEAQGKVLSADELTDYRDDGNNEDNNDDHNAWRRFALEQLGRSYGILSHRHISKDPQLGIVTLLCCLMFVLSEFLLGEYGHAFMHLQNGIKILKEYGYVQSDDDSVRRSLVAAFLQLEVMSASIYPTGKVLDDTNIEQHAANLLVFHTLREACHEFSGIYHAACNLITSFSGWSDEEFASQYDSICGVQRRICSDLEHFATRFSAFYKQSYLHLSLKEQRGADLLYMQQISVPLSLVCTLQNEDLHKYAEDFKLLLSLAETFINKFPERPRVTVDMGLIVPLFVVLFASPDYDDRWKAIKLLRAWPHREGPLNSTIVARIAIDRMRAQGMIKPDGQTESGDNDTSRVVSLSPHQTFATRANHQHYAGMSMEP
ncbi:hypothetical protein BBP40_000802 [Aspergillus hancockii]|nr:hypothetical protein BBP40_000802 [Aspergillus hancockii]